MQHSEVVRWLQKNGTEGLYDYSDVFASGLEYTTWMDVIRGLEAENLALAEEALRDLQEMVTSKDAKIVADAALEWFEQSMG